MSKRPRPTSISSLFNGTRNLTHKKAKKLPHESLVRPELRCPSTARAKEIDADPPYNHLKSALSAQSRNVDVRKVLHWFRGRDLRIQDNKALCAASDLAAKELKPLIGVYVYCPSEEAWHGTSPARIDFILEALRLVQKELRELDIPLVFLVAEDRKRYVPVLEEFIRKEGVSHVFANYEYEIGELRRDIKFVKEMGDEIEVRMYHDQTVVEPGTVLTESGTPMKVFTPYHRAWTAQVRKDPSLLDTVPPPARNVKDAVTQISHLFDSRVPDPREDQRFKTAEEKKRIRKLWPPGHAAGLQRMDNFLKQISRYAATRSNPAENSTSRMSAYFSSGQVSVREALLRVADYNQGRCDFSEGGASKGIYGWVREIVFRELYRQTTLTVPHSAMNLPQNLKFAFVRWEEDEEGWEKWYQGKTGEPFIDAGMRQLHAEAYMHNRLRMNVSSYLYCNLLIDHRRGERYFAETLIDWDMSNNTQGWEPGYTVFNPVSQAEKNDPDGEYIRKWVPELRNVEGKAIFAPYARLPKEEFERLGYPKPHVDWKASKARAMERFKRGMHDAEP